MQSALVPFTSILQISGKQVTVTPNDVSNITAIIITTIKMKRDFPRLHPLFFPFQNGPPHI